jgi:hypothetical protein
LQSRRVARSKTLPCKTGRAASSTGRALMQPGGRPQDIARSKPQKARSWRHGELRSEGDAHHVGKWSPAQGGLQDADGNCVPDGRNLQPRTGRPPDVARR